MFLVSRHEEREVEMRKEFNTLQQRYSELLRTKADQKHRNINSQCTTDDRSSGCQSPMLSLRQKSDKPIRVATISRQEIDNIPHEVSIMFITN